VYQPSGALPVRLREYRHGLGQMRAFGGLVDLLIADPAQAMCGDLEAELAIGRHGLRMALQRARHREYRQRQARSVRRRAARATIPAREPYSNIDSMLMWRIGYAVAPMISDRKVSEAASPSSTQFSAPSSWFKTNCTAMRAPCGQRP
jgi:hypothetical protein